MPDDNEAVGLDELPAVDLPDPATFQDENGPVDPDDGAGMDAVATDLGWPFCLRYDSRPWQTMLFRADSAAEAAAWANAYTRFMESVLVAAGYPSGLCSWTSGACPL